MVDVYSRAELARLRLMNEKNISTNVKTDLFSVDDLRLHALEQLYFHRLGEHISQDNIVQYTSIVEPHLLQAAQNIVDILGIDRFLSGFSISDFEAGVCKRYNVENINNVSKSTGGWNTGNPHRIIPIFENHEFFLQIRAYLCTLDVGPTALFFQGVEDAMRDQVNLMIDYCLTENMVNDL